MKTFDLSESNEEGGDGGEGEISLKRVSVIALDLDWIFLENNAKVMLNLL